MNLGQLQTCTMRNLQRHRRRHPGHMIEIDHDDAFPAELPHELAAERVRGRHQDTAAGRKMAA
jgi:hypothetical protein